MVAAEPGSRINRFLLGQLFHDMQVLQSACFNPKEFPVHVLADDQVFALVKRNRRGILIELYILAGWVIVRSMKGLL